MNIGNFWTRLMSTLMMFATICTTYSIGRRIKDAVISIYVGVEYINTIKLFFILPVTLFVMLLYQKITLNAKDDVRNRVRYILNFPFLIYFIFYGIVEFTNNHHLLNRYVIDLSHILKYLPGFLRSLSAQIEHVFLHIWDVLLYVSVEVYGTLILSFSFWQYVNSYTTREDAKVLYPYYTSSASISMIAAGTIGYVINMILHNLNIFSKINIFGSSYDSMFHSMNILVMSFGVLLSIVGYHISLREHISDYEGSPEQTEDLKTKKSMTLGEAISKITSNRIVLCMGACVLCYMICINLIEVSWKKQVYNYYRVYQHNPKGMSNLYSYVQIVAGLLSLVSGIIVRYLLQYSWLITALVTPIMVGFLGIVFLISASFSPTSTLVSSQEISYMFIPVLLGAIQNAFAKSSKYTFFDITKETSLLYVPKQLRDGSKGAIDMICGRLGKSTGGVIQITLLSLLVSPENMKHGQEMIVPYLTVVVGALTLVWLSTTVLSNNAIISMIDENASASKSAKSSKSAKPDIKSEHNGTNSNSDNNK